MSPEDGPGARPLWGPSRRSPQPVPDAGPQPAAETWAPGRPAPQPGLPGPPASDAGSIPPPLVPPRPDPAGPAYPPHAPSPSFPPAGAGRPPARPPAAGADRRVVVMIAGAVLLVVVVVAVAALVGAGAFGPGAVAAAPSSNPSVAPGSPTRGTSQAAPATTAPVLTSPDGLVRMDPTAAAGVPVTTQQAVLDVLHRHFTAINTLDYPAWATTVVPRRAQDQPSVAWSDAYATTYDEAVMVTSLAPAGSDSVVVGLSFVSNQAVADAPTDLPVDRICWQTRWPVVGISTGGRIDAPPSGTTTKHAC